VEVRSYAPWSGLKRKNGKKMKTENHPVSICLAPMKADAIVRAAKDAAKFIERFKTELQDAGFDMDVYAPRDSSIAAHYKRLTIQQLAEWDKPVYRPNEPHLCHFSEEKGKRFVKSAEEDAAAQYDLFVAKLVRKVGDVESAEIEGNHIWGHSILTVMKRDGAELYGERWKTQQIVNVSKLGKLFNQWPSRKIK